MKNKDKIIEVLISLTICAIIGGVIGRDIIPCTVYGNSMYPTLKKDDFGLSFRHKKLFIKRFDYIIFKNNNTVLVKRVIGLPGDTLEYQDDVLYINGIKTEEPFTRTSAKDNLIVLKEDEYYCLGDNREFSFDSSEFGPIDKSQIISAGFMKLKSGN